MNRNITICATDLTVITGHNPYKDLDEIRLKFWKRYFRDDYERVVNKLKNANVEMKREESDFDTIKRLAKENNLNINFSNCLKSDNVSELQKVKSQVMEKVGKTMNKEKKKEFEKSFNSFTNTNFGIKYENKAGDLYEKKTGCKIIKTNKYHKLELFIIPNEMRMNDIWSIGGKIDGILLPENKIIEIKNRVNNLFYKLRNYEKVQCYVYMFLLESFETDLIEVLKKPGDNSMNIINIKFDDKFWEKEIMYNLEVFINDFYDFLENDKRKISLLKNSE